MLNGKEVAIMVAITLQVPDSVERKLHARAAEQGRDPASVAVEIIEKELEKSPATGGNERLTGDAWLREFDAWVKSHRKIDVVLDDSRESIYEGRGE
jgi:hypothetical protein